MFAKGRVARKLPLDDWRPGTMVEMDGFLKRYRGKTQLVLHWGREVAGGPGPR